MMLALDSTQGIMCSCSDSSLQTLTVSLSLSICILTCMVQSGCSPGQPAEAWGQTSVHRAAMTLLWSSCSHKSSAAKTSWATCKMQPPHWPCHISLHLSMSQLRCVCR